MSLNCHHRGFKDEQCVSVILFYTRASCDANAVRFLIPKSICLCIVFVIYVAYYRVWLLIQWYAQFSAFIMTRPAEYAMGTLISCIQIYMIFLNDKLVWYIVMSNDIRWRSWLRGIPRCSMRVDGGYVHTILVVSYSILIKLMIFFSMYVAC